jgi:pimeloyl-ACP methyl ester carboxylesterase
VGTVQSWDGTEIWYSDSGGDGPVVALLHGLTMTSITNFEVHFGPDADGRVGRAEGPTIHGRLREAGGRVIGVDSRGHGRSGRSSDPDRYRGDAYARDVIAVLDDAGVEVCDLVGYSFGAITACRLPSLDAPIRSMALCGAGPRFVEGQDPMDFVPRVGECFRSGNWNEHPEFKPYRYFARLDDAHDFESLGAAMIAFEPVERSRLAWARCPVLVLNGGDDDGDGDAERLAAMIPGARAQVAGDADHGMACSNTDFQQALVDFVTSNW